MRSEPDARFRAVAATDTEPVHDLEARLWRFLRGIEDDVHVARAVEIYRDSFERERLQPWIIAGATNADIAARLGMSVEVVDVYRHACFNPLMFRDVLDKQRWVANYGTRRDSTREGVLFLQKAMLHGVEAIAHVMGVESKLDPSAVLEQAMRDTFFRGLAMRDAKLTSGEAQVGHGLIKTAVALATEQAKLRPPGVQEVLLRIKNRDMTQPIEVIEMAGEVLH